MTPKSNEDFIETTMTRQELLELIDAHVAKAPDSILEKVLELFEDEQDIANAHAALEKAQIEGFITWDEYKRESA